MDLLTSVRIEDGKMAVSPTGESVIRHTTFLAIWLALPFSGISSLGPQISGHFLPRGQQQPRSGEPRQEIENNPGEGLVLTGSVQNKPSSHTPQMVPCEPSLMDLGKPLRQCGIWSAS